MPKFFLAYKGGSQPETPEAGQAMMDEWNQWIADMGPKMPVPGDPFGKSYTVTAEGATLGAGPMPLMGYSVIEVDTLEEALEIAQNCPFMKMKGAQIELAQLMAM